MHDDNIAVSATCVPRGGIYGHSEAVNVEFTNSMGPAKPKRILSQSPVLKLTDDPATACFAGNIRRREPMSIYGTHPNDVSHSNSWVMWIVADNIRKGAALNAVQLQKEMYKERLAPPEVK